jgi:group II intron reverse transcriptase/maturase
MPAEERGLGSKRAPKARKERRLGNLATPEKIQKLRQALYAKAKGEPGFRFYRLYDKVYREDILSYAFACCRFNGGAPGADGVTFEDVEAYGREKWLGELASELRGKTYKPGAIRRVFIPKPNGKQRPLGIPNLKDRVCQTAATIVLEPIFEADLPPEQYAYRSGKNAHEAVDEVHRLLNCGHQEVVDADLSGYFDTIPHAELMKSVARRIVDKGILHLIKMWLEAPVEEDDGAGGRKRTTRSKDDRRSIPQGAPISPLLANLYMRRFIAGWKKFGYEERFGAKVVNYADDLVICCQRGWADMAMSELRRMMKLLKLTINEEKTRVCRVPEESFDFLGYTFGRLYSYKRRKSYIGSKPSKKSIKQIIEEIRIQTGRNTLWMEAGELVRILNRKLQGWANYFRLGSVSRIYGRIDIHVQNRLCRWACRKHKGRSRVNKRYPYEIFYKELGLMRLSQTLHSLPWVKA